MENTTTSLSKISPTSYRKLSYPTKPQKVVDYYNQSFEMRDRMNKQPDDFKGFWFDTDVKGYFDTRDKVISTNWANRNFLNLLKNEAIQKGEEYGLIDSVLSDFQPQDYLFPIETKGREDVPEEVTEAANRFRGSVVNRGWQK